MSYFQTFTFPEIISLAVVDFEKQARSWSVSSSLINIYFKYYIIYCKKKSSRYVIWKKTEKQLRLLIITTSKD
jgi:hypothetical protein